MNDAVGVPVLPDLLVWALSYQRLLAVLPSSFFFFFFIFLYLDRCEAPFGGIDRLLRPRLRAWAKRKRKLGPTHSRCACVRACVRVSVCWLPCRPLSDRDQRFNFFFPICVCISILFCYGDIHTHMWCPVITTNKIKKVPLFFFRRIDGKAYLFPWFCLFCFFCIGTLVLLLQPI